MEWPSEAGEDLKVQVHRLIGAVVALGGAVGWIEVPDRSETDGWLLGVLAEVRRGDAALAVVHHQGQLAAMGSWRRVDGPIFAHSALIAKVMVHPEARRQGLARTVLTALVDHAAGAGIETLQLSVRGNNHGAIALYQSLGFTIWGRQPNVIEVGPLRFDDVRMARTLGDRSHLQLIGSAPVGPGSSPRPDPTAPGAQPRAPMGQDTPVPPNPQ